MFCNINDKLNDPVVQEILSCCLTDNSPEGIDRALNKYLGEQFYGWFDNDIPLAVCGFRVLQNKVEICHIAVAKNARGKGIGSAIVSTLCKTYGMILEAETDDEAVGFYRKCGFETTAIYKEYGGKEYRRWTCVFRKDSAFWQAIDKLVTESKIVIDRPKGSSHPKYPQLTYPVDYGYLENTSSMDGGGIDVWKGTNGGTVDAIICTVDLMKRDSEIKILIGCDEDEKGLLLETHNNSKCMKGILIRRDTE